ncbi:MAG TPA: serine/threonine protein kinase, partial [Opitutae bacterium]|nr:serine/threonine protein kinase [Opitutae bacterium]
MQYFFYFLLLLPLGVVSANWQQWRGPNASGHAPKGNYPKTWNPKLNIQWKSNLPGRGHSSPVTEGS